MQRIFLLAAINLLSAAACAQTLTIEKIMRDPKWIGTSPDNLFWGADGKTVYFSWNPEKALADSLYSISIDRQQPRKTSPAERQHIQVMANASYNIPRTQMVYTWQGDVFLRDVASGKETRITRTADLESGAEFGFHDSRILFRRDRDIYSWEIQTGLIEQLPDFVNGSKPAERSERLNAQDQYLKDQQQELFQALKDKKAKSDAATAFSKSLPKNQQLRSLYLDDRSLSDARVSPDGRFVVYRVFRESGPGKGAMIPTFVTESGFTGELRTNAKVGTPQPSFESFVFDRLKDTVIAVKTSAIPGIGDKPDYLKDYPGKDTAKRAPRGVIINGPYWSEKGTHGIVDIHSQDNKDRWIMLLDAATGTLKPVDRQRDEAWIGGPGIGWGGTGWIDENTCWFQSEATGYSHLYTFNVATGQKKALTQGNYEVQEAELSRNKQYFYITTNEVHPGEKQFYRLPVNGGRAERITSTLPMHSKL